MRHPHRPHRTLAGAAALACATLSLVPRPAAAVQYSLIDLSAFGPADTYATAINNAGQIVGTFSFPGDPTPHAFLLDPDLHALPIDYFAPSTTARAVNSLGQVVGTASYNPFDRRATLFAPPGSPTPPAYLSTLPSDAYAINSAGQVAGSVTLGPEHAALFSTDPSSPYLDLGTLGGPSSRATGINDAGLVVGTADTLPGPSHAFLYSPATGMSDLGTLAGLPYFSSSASAINSLGQVVGSSDTLAGRSHAFLFSPTQGMTDLGSLYDGASAALALNASAQIVGTSAGRAFLWSDGHMSDLNSLTPSLFPGWTLTSATGISDSGQIVAQATIEGGGPARSLLLTPIPIAQSWTGAAGTTDFSAPNNWHPNTPPDAYSDLTTLGWGQTISLSSPSSARSLTADGTLTLDLASHSLSIAHDLNLASYAPSTLTLSNGTASADHVFLAGSPGNGPLGPGTSNTLRLANASLSAASSVTVYDFGTLQLSANSFVTAPLLTLAGTLDAAAGTNTVSAPVQVAPTVYPPTLSASAPDATLVLTGNLSDPRPYGPIFQAQGPGTIELRGNNSLNMFFAVNPTTTLRLSAGSTHANTVFVYGTLLASDTSVSLDNDLSIFPLTATSPATAELRPGSSLSANNVFLDGTGGGTATLRIAGGSLTVTNNFNLNLNPGSPNTDDTPVHVEHSAGSVTANTLNIGSLVPATYSLSGGSLTAQQEYIANHSAFTQTGGTHAVTGPSALSIGGSSAYTQSGGSLTVPGTLALYDSSSYTLSAGTLTVGTLSTVTYPGGPSPSIHQTGGAASVSQLSLTAPYDYDLAAGTLTLAAPNLPYLPTDLRDRLLYTSSPTATLGYLLNPSDNTITVKPTTPGDANLDGAITPDDYTLLDKSFASHLSNAYWWQGDFNYDGQIDASDYLLIDRTLAHTQGLSPTLLAQRQSQFGDAYVQSLLTSVPEPASPLACLFATLLLSGRRQRHAKKFALPAPNQTGHLE